jgi:hypothetical protein
MKRMALSLREARTGCPVETFNLTANLDNRKKAVDKYGYGPANPDEPNEDFWKGKAALFKTTVDQAKTMRCGNCAAFDISDKMRKCIADGMVKDNTSPDAVIEKADLGYCTILHFKCAGERTCDAWLVSGPLDNKDK